MMSRKTLPLFAFVCFAGIAAAVVGVLLLAVPSGAGAGASATPKPRAEVPEQIHDFGVMDPFTDGRHTFLIYNRGDAPLHLSKGETSCKCTFSDLPENTIPPRSVGRVTLEWKTHKVRDLFANTAEVVTDDPDNRVITFRIEGKVRHKVRTSPEGLTFDSLAPGERAEGSFLVYSQTWDAFRLENVSVTLPGVTWSTREATPDELESVLAKSGVHVDVVLPGDLKSGPFSGSVLFDAVPESGEEIGQHYETLFAGKVASNLSIHGLEFTLNGGLDLGTFVQGERKEWNGLIRLRGERQTLEVQSIETVPSYLQVSVEPLLADGQPKPGMYRFRIVLPEDAETGAYNKNTQVGRIVLRTDHPQTPVVDIPLSIAVMSAYAE